MVGGVLRRGRFGLGLIGCGRRAWNLSCTGGVVEDVVDHTPQDVDVSLIGNEVVVWSWSIGI